MLLSYAQTIVGGFPVALSLEETALIGTIYAPPVARRPWMLTDVLPDVPHRYHSLARWALVDALRTCGVGEGDHVLVPALICRDILAPVHVVGATPLFYPVTRQLSADLSETPVDGAKTILAVNYFGFPQDLQPFRRLCAHTGAALIEDNAHGLFSRDDDGRWLGGRGDAGLFSFRKTIAVPNGAALVLTGGRQIRPEVRTARRVRTAGLRYRAKQTVRRLAGHVDPVQAHHVIAAFRRMRQLATGEAIPSPGDAETRIPIPSDPPAALETAVTVAEPELESRRRRALYDIAARVLAKTGAVPVFPSLPPHVVPYGFPIFVAPEDEPRVAAVVARHGFQLARWPDLPIVVRPTAPEHYRRLMVLPFLW